MVPAKTQNDLKGKFQLKVNGNHPGCLCMSTETRDTDQDSMRSELLGEMSNRPQTSVFCFPERSEIREDTGQLESIKISHYTYRSRTHSNKSMNPVRPSYILDQV